MLITVFFPLLSINSFFFFYSRIFSLLFFIFIQRFCKCGAPPEAGGPMLKHLKHICWSGSDQSMPFTSINSQVKSNQAGFYWHRWRANVLYLFYRVFNYGWLILNRWCVSHGHYTVFFFFSSFSILFDVFCIKISMVLVK